MRITKPNRHPTQTAAPTRHLTGEALARLLATLPPLLPHVPPEWRRSRQKKITKEIAALHLVTALQAHLAGQIVLFRHLATSEMAWARLQTIPPELARLRGHGAARIMRAGDLMVHASACSKNARCPRPPPRQQQPPPRPRQPHRTAATPCAQTRTARYPQPSPGDRPAPPGPRPRRPTTPPTGAAA